MKPTFKNEDHLMGFIDAFIYRFETDNGDLEGYDLHVNIKKIERTYNVRFNWSGQRFLIQHATREEPAEYDYRHYDDSFMILEDESISKLEQFVTDSLNLVMDTDLYD